MAAGFNTSILAVWRKVKVTRISAMTGLEPKTLRSGVMRSTRFEAPPSITLPAEQIRLVVLKNQPASTDK